MRLHWININDRAPKDGAVVLACGEEVDANLFKYVDLTKPGREGHGRHLFSNGRETVIDIVSHWMPNPFPHRGDN
jgi:hypothetical protein